MKVLTTAVVIAACCVAASAQTAPARPDSAAPEPKVQHIVVEDEAVRIEELRVRGLTQRIVVKPKNAAEYEIVAPTGGRDPSQNRGNQQPGAAGQRVWSLLKF